MFVDSVVIRSSAKINNKQFFSLQHNKAEFSLKIVDQMPQKSASTKYLDVLLDNSI